MQGSPFYPIWQCYGRSTLILALCSLFSMALLVLRIYLSGKTNFIFLIWNLFLAWIPLLLSFIAAYLDHRGSRRWLMLLLSALWLLFFPNAPYITTDFLHLRFNPPMPLWYDLLLIFSFAWVGLLLGFRSLREMHALYTRWLGKTGGWLWVVASMGLSAFGIYLGRYLRWNSWDIITQPASLFADIAHRLTHLHLHPRTLGMTLSYSFFLFLSYLSLYFFQEKVEHRSV